MTKPLESWCALVPDAYAAGCSYYFSHSADSLATRYFAYAVYATVGTLLLVARRGNGEARCFSGDSMLLFETGLLLTLLINLGVSKQ